MLNQVKFPPFDAKCSKWSRYFQQLKFFLAANKVEEELKLSTVLSLLGDSTFNLLCDLIAPELPDSKSVDEVFQILEQHFSPKLIARSERFKFRNRKQNQGESVTDFIAALRKMSVDCAFEEKLDFNLSDQFIFGLSDVSIQKRLLGEDDKTSLSKLVQIASIAEMTASNALACNFSPPASFSNVGKVQHLPNNTCCRHCGSLAHSPASCKFKEAICHFCHKKGHIAPICRAKKHSQSSGDQKSRRRAHVVHVAEQDSSSGLQAEEDEEEETLLMNMFSVKRVEETHVKPIMLRVGLNGVPVDFELDTGASISLIPAKLYKELLSFITLQKTNVILSAFNHSIFPMGKIFVKVQFCNKLVDNLELYVVKECVVPLLGRTWFKALGLLQEPIINVKTIAILDSASNKLDLLLKKYEQLFSPELGCISDFKAHLFTKEGAVPRFFKHRPVPFALLPLIDQEISKLQHQGILSPVKFSEWAAPIVPIIKKDKTIRICGDYKVGLNPALLVDQYPLPVINEILAKLSGGVIFSKLDMSQAYQQVEMDEESSKFLTINTHKGLFQVKRLPFGISSAPAIFQELMDKTLAGIPHTVCYLDDILVASLDVSSHLEDLEMVLQRLQERGIRLNRPKCEFFKDEVVYLGHVINSRGIHASREKVEAILSAPEPSSVDQLRSFLGLVSYYRKFLPDLATVLAPLNLLLSKKAKWSWGREAKQAMLKVKEAIVSTDVLMHYNPALPLVLAADASPTGLGAVISHLCPDGQEHPIAFASRTLTFPERNYSQLDKEALAIVFAVKKFHQFLFGRKFLLFTDHKPLTYIFNPSKHVPVIAAARLQRWAQLLAAYSYEIKFRPSKENLNADALSRSPRAGIEPSPDEIPMDLHLVNHLDSFPVSYQEISVETRKDPLLSHVFQSLKQGWPKTSTSAELAPFKSRADEISIQQGCLLWGLRVIIPAALRGILLKELHLHHTGIVRMKMLARTLFWWPGMDQDIEHLALSCTSCALQAKDPPKVAVHTWIRPDEPWDRIHVDFAGPFMGHMFLILVDAFSKWPEVAIMTSVDTAHTISVLESYFSRYGYPKHLVSDNGSQFTSAEFASFCKARGIHHTLSAPYHPASNGQAERFVQTFKSFMIKISHVRNLSWKVYDLLLSYRSTPHTVTRKSPAELFLGRQIRTRLHLVKPPSSPFVPYKSAVVVQPRSLVVGEAVLSKSFNVSKLADKWVFGHVRRKLGPLTYWIVFQDGKEGKRHIDQLRSARALETGSSEKRSEDAASSDWTFIQTEVPLGPVPYGIEPDPAPMCQRRYPARVRLPPDHFGMNFRTPI